MKFCNQVLSILFSLAAVSPSGVQAAERTSLMSEVAMPAKVEAHMKGKDLVPYDISEITSNEIKKYTRRKGEVPCVDGMIAGRFPCKNMNLVSFLTGKELGSPYAFTEDPIIYSTWVSDIWGWTDPETGKEYGLIGMWDGTCDNQCAAAESSLCSSF